MWLVLAEPDDADARWAADGLAEHGLDGIELVTADDLATARLVHRLGRAGSSFEAALLDGRTIHGREVTGVLNRLRGAPERAVARGTLSDRSYAEQEWWAFMLGWLQVFQGPVLNPAGPRGLCGAWRYPAEWRRLAHLGGLPAVPYRAGDPEPEVRAYALVVGSQSFGSDALAGLGAGCVRMAALAATPLLEIWFAVEDERPGVVGATPLPTLRAGGQPALSALATALAGQPSGRPV